MSVGNNIRTIRKAKKLTQKELAELATISRTYLADVENERYNPSLDTLKLIANGLNVPISSLLDDYINTETSINVDEDLKELYFKIRNLDESKKTLIKNLIEEFDKNK